MNRSLRVALAATMLVVSVAGFAAASEKLTAETGKSCTTCHDKPGSKLLTDQGKYFETTRTLQGYVELRDTFGKCTSCHVRRPGSKKLTKQGRQFGDVAKDMASVRKLMQEGHPTAPAK